jgi:hypothetical protein
MSNLWEEAQMNDSLRREIERLRAELDLERRRLATSEDLRTSLAEALIKARAINAELLAACMYIVNAGETGDEMVAVEKARAAIAKARGI